jgi:hypothetical protein
MQFVTTDAVAIQLSLHIVTEADVHPTVHLSEATLTDTTPVSARPETGEVGLAPIKAFAGTTASKPVI